MSLSGGRGPLIVGAGERGKREAPRLPLHDQRATPSERAMQKSRSPGGATCKQNHQALSANAKAQHSRIVLASAQHILSREIDLILGNEGGGCYMILTCLVARTHAATRVKF